MFHMKSSFSLSLSLPSSQCEVWMLISESSWRLFNWSNLLCWTVAVLWEYLAWHGRFLSLSYSTLILFHATIFIALTRFRAGLQVHRGKWMASSWLEPPVEHERCCPKVLWQLWKVKEVWGGAGGSQWKEPERQTDTSDGPDLHCLKLSMQFTVFLNRFGSILEWKFFYPQNNKFRSLNNSFLFTPDLHRQDPFLKP